MDAQQIIRQIQQGTYHPVYLLHGNEAYFIDKIAAAIEEQVLTPAERSFNQTVFYGKDVEAKTLIDTAYRYPMMASHQVVILKEAQDMRSLKDIKPYVDKPVQTTVLVICHKHKKLAMNTALGKALKKNALVFESKKLYDNKMPAWIQQYLKSRNYSVDAQAASLIAEYLGTNLSKVTNELEKLIINLPIGTSITSKHIEEQIGISKDYNIFELQKALGFKDVLKANRIVNYFIANPKKHPTVLVIGTLYNYFSKILIYNTLQGKPESEVLAAMSLRSSFFLKEYRQSARNYARPQLVRVFSILKEYDLKSKGVDFNATNTKDGELLREMIWKILHV